VNGNASMTAVNESLAQLLRWHKLAREADTLERALYRAGVAADGERERRTHKARNRALDRVGRRRWAIERIHAGKPIVTTAQVYAWMWANISDYRRGLGGMDGVDSAEIAGDACEALDLWDADGSIPMWVWRCGEVVSVREEEQRQRRMALFVEKKIKYEEDGDVLFA